MTNYFLVSLSVADLFVAILVMPLRTAVDLFDGKWTLGVGVCIVWLTADVLMCTASIWHMCTMSLDRWLSLKYPMKYGRNKTAKWVLTKILFVWLISIAISSPVCVLGLMRTTAVYDGTYCLPKSRDFVLYGSVFAFYIPFAVMLVTYVLTLRILCRNQLTVHGRVVGSGSDEEALAGKRRKSEIISKRTASNEKKASKVLGVIFSVFVILWTPFFVVNILSVVCQTNCSFSPTGVAIIVWLGYLSSLANPIIYTMFNTTFRNAFAEVLTCRRRRFSSTSSSRITYTSNALKNKQLQRRRPEIILLQDRLTSSQLS